MQELANGIYYLAGGVNCGILETGDGGCLIVDTGNSEDSGKKILKNCRAANLEPRAIINTHSHADHYGGNAYLVKHTGIPVYAPIFEESILHYPILEPIYLWSGARAPKELHNKFLVSAPSPAKALNESGKRKIAGLEIELLEVSGHAHIQFAVLAGEVLFAADSVFGAGILEKYPLSFMVDIENALQAIETVRYCGAKIIVPGHGEPTTEINALCDTNLRVLKNANQAVLSACYDIGTTPEILARVCAMLEITMTDLTGYVLNQTAVLAHLTDLEERGLIRRDIVQNTLVWQALN